MYSEQQTIIKNGLWSNNVALVQLLGLCPLLAVTSTFINGLGLGVATLITLVLSNTFVSIIRHWTRPEVRIPIFILIIASIVTAIELAMNAWFYELFLILGIFIPLIVTNCSILARAESFASRNNVLDSALDGFMMGMGFLLVLILLIYEWQKKATSVLNLMACSRPIVESRWAMSFISARSMRRK